MYGDLQYLLPGIQDNYTNLENVVWWGKWERQVIMAGVIDSATVDAGNTPTTLLRAGLLMGRISTTRKLTTWNPAPDGTDDGSENLFGVLLATQQTTIAGTATARIGHVLVAGNVIASGLVIPGEASAGINGTDGELRVRNQLAGRFITDDEPYTLGVGRWRVKTVPSNASYTVAESDNGTWFIVEGAAGATTFTLPALTTAKRSGFNIRITNAVGQNLTIAAPGSDDTLVAFNDLTADSVVLSTAGELIGGTFEILGITSGKYIVVPMLWEGQTPTIA